MLFFKGQGLALLAVAGAEVGGVAQVYTFQFFGALVGVDENHHADAAFLSARHVHLVAAHHGDICPAHVNARGDGGECGVEVPGRAESDGGYIVGFDVVGLD